jgi:hypothetical protein
MQRAFIDSRGPVSQTIASRRCEQIAPWPTQEHHHGLMSFTEENNHPGCSQQEDRVHV